MAKNRPAIPKETQREVLFQARHRCAVCCEPIPLEKAHIRPWNKSHDNCAGNLIALCANCHERADNEKWGEAYLHRYKQDPCALAANAMPPMSPQQKAMVDLIIACDPDSMTDKERRRLLSMIAAYVDVPLSTVSVILIGLANSTRVRLELPAQAVDKLLEGFKNKDPLISIFLEDFRLIRVEAAQKAYLQTSKSQRLFQYDVFLSYNSKDKPRVRRLAEKLRSAGLRVWFDEWIIEFGEDIYSAIENGLEVTRTLVLCLSPSALGSGWVSLERSTALFRDPTNSERRFIPLVLSQCDMPDTLKRLKYIDYRDESEVAMKSLILASRPVVSPEIASDQPATDSVTRIHCKLNCRELQAEVLHARPAAFVAQLCKMFPNTFFNLYKKGGLKPVDPKQALQLILGSFVHGEDVVLEVKGNLRVMAAEFFKVAWENLAGYSDNIAAVKSRILKLIDEAYVRVHDPDLEELDHQLLASNMNGLTSMPEEHRSIAIINDRLHNISLPMIPMIAKYFDSPLEIGFEIPHKGVFLFQMNAENGFELNQQILELNIGVGTAITLLTSGPNRFKTSESVKSVLENLWQCDEWLRGRGNDIDGLSIVPELLAFAKEVGESHNAEYGYVQNPFVSNLLTVRQVLVNPRGMRFQKSEALSQLVSPHAVLHELETSSILKRIQDVEREQPIILRPGFAIAHAAMDRSPRISITFGVYPDGIQWTKDGQMVKLVAMVICARDTHKTWRDYLQKFSTLFRSNPSLQDELITSKRSEDFIAMLRNVEIAKSSKPPRRRASGREKR